MRLVDIAPMLEKLDLEHYDKDYYVNQFSADWIYSWLDSQPTIEAEPVKHGRWIVLGQRTYGSGSGRNYTHYCSECGQHGFDDYKLCPNCGCKMDLED